MLTGIVFFLGVCVGFVAHRYSFCPLGALVELFALGRAQRAMGMVAAMVAFAPAHFMGLSHGHEQASALFLVAGVVQGVGYYLASGCTLGLLVRLGEGSKLHFVVLLSFMAGAGAYAVLAWPARSAAASVLPTASLRHGLNLDRPPHAAKMRAWDLWAWVPSSPQGYAALSVNGVDRASRQRPRRSSCRPAVPGWVRVCRLRAMHTTRPTEGRPLSVPLCWVPDGAGRTGTARRQDDAGRGWFRSLFSGCPTGLPHREWPVRTDPSPGT